MSSKVEVKCRSGKNKGKNVRLRSFYIVKGKRSRGNGYWYQIRGESMYCNDVLTKFTTEDFAMKWQKSTGKKIAIWTPNASKQKATRNRTRRRKERKQRQKNKAKAKEKREKNRAKRNQK